MAPMPASTVIDTSPAVEPKAPGKAVAASAPSPAPMTSEGAKAPPGVPDATTRVVQTPLATTIAMRSGVNSAMRRNSLMAS